MAENTPLVPDQSEVIPQHIGIEPEGIPDQRPGREDMPRHSDAILIAHLARLVVQAEDLSDWPGLASDSGYDAAVRRWWAAAEQCLYDSQAAGPAAVAAWHRLLLSYFLRSSFVAHARAKPFGYPGDYLSLSLLHALRPAGEGAFGTVLDSIALQRPAAAAVRSRTRLIGDILSRSALDSAPKPFRALSLGCGPALEVFDRLGDAHKAVITMIDLDEHAVAQARRRARLLPRSVAVQVERLSPLALALTERRNGLAQDFIWGMGLLDCLRDRSAVAALNWAYENLADGGVAYFSNLERGHADAAFCEEVLDWQLVLRSADDVRELIGRSKFRFGNVVADETGAQLVLSVAK